MNHDFQGPFNETGLKPGSPVSHFRSYFLRFMASVGAWNYFSGLVRQQMAPEYIQHFARISTKRSY